MYSTSERISFETKVHQGNHGEQIYLGRSSDLSLGGMYLTTSSRFTVDEHVDISFIFPYENRDIVINCSTRVAWTNYEDYRQKRDYPPGVGLEFTGLSRQLSQYLAVYIYTYDENKKMNMVCAWCGKKLGFRKGPYGKTSHGICGDCRDKHF